MLANSAVAQGDVSPSLGAKWANTVAGTLGLHKESTLPPLTPVSAAQPLPLRFIMDEQTGRGNRSRSDSKDSVEQHRGPGSALSVPRVRVQVLADIDKAAACSPKGWKFGGTKANKDYFIHQGGIRQLYIQVCMHLLEHSQTELWL